MAANYWFLCLFVKKYCLHNARLLTFTTANALFRFENYASTRKFFQCSTGAGLHTRGILAGDTNHGHKTTSHTTTGSYFDRAFG